MARHPSQTQTDDSTKAPAPADASPADDATAARAQAHADYVHDQLQQERTVYDHAQTLRTRAPARITAAKAARTSAGMPADPSSADDTLSHYHVVERMLDERAFYPPHDKRTESPPMPRSTTR